MLPGRRAGAQCGKGVWDLARSYFDASVTNTPIFLTMRRLAADQCEVRYNTLRGIFYKLQSTPDLSQSFTNDPAGFVQAFDTAMLRTNSLSGQNFFYRFISGSGP